MAVGNIRTPDSERYPGVSTFRRTPEDQGKLEGKDRNLKWGPPLLKSYICVAKMISSVSLTDMVVATEDLLDRGFRAEVTV